MDPRFQTSFIPKKPIVAEASVKSSSVNLFSLIAVILFVLSLALTGGVFFYKRLVVQNIESSKVTLERARDAFEPDLIKKIVRLDARIENTKTLLATHISVTELFNALSQNTLRSVRFKDFDFAYVAPDKIELSMQGQAQSYAAVALQSDLFNAQNYLSETLIGGLSLESSGLIGFTIQTTVSPSLLAYKAQAGATPVESATTSTTQTP